VADKASANISIDPKSLSSIANFELGFLEVADPKKFNAMLQLATLNAARTMVKPIKSEAPVDSGRLKSAVAARKGRFNKPSGVVGIKAGRARGDLKGAWYRYFVTSGHAVRGTKQGTVAGRTGVTWAQAAAGEKAVSAGARKRVPANDFVARVSQNEGVRTKAMDTIANTINAFIEGKIKYKGRRAKA
jgi:hypothetical protein